jgi:hypothetical protein
MFVPGPPRFDIVWAMKRALAFRVSLAMVPMLLVAGGCAKPHAAEPTPSLLSAQVLVDHRVTFRLRAPNAKVVALALEGSHAMPMVMDDEGLWSVTTPPLEPDLYGYSFVADGVATLDPSNPLLKTSLIQTQNLVHVPGPVSLPWEVRDVPRGTLHHHFYASAVVGDSRDYFVYTPGLRLRGQDGLSRSLPPPRLQ